MAFLASPADIAIYGGAAGGGKSWAMLVEPLRHIDKRGFFAVIFRRHAVQVRNPGGLWDESMKLYPPLEAWPSQQALEWNFPSGARVKFAHLENDATVNDWQGSQVALICFDELCHFSRFQFFYMLSRNRSVCGVRPYVRATCNPDSDSWVASFISWWVDPATGYPIKERSGKLRWFVMDGEKLDWADTKEELIAAHGEGCGPKSVTFIASSIHDNQILLKANPGYLHNLQALPKVDRERLLNGNWKIRPAAGLLFRREWVQVVEALPADLQACLDKGAAGNVVRWWDLAATEKTEANDPDYTASVALGKSGNGKFYVMGGLSMRKSPMHVEQAILNLASQEGKGVTIGLPQDPGQAGKAQAQNLARKLAGWRVVTRPETGDKVTRFGPFSAQCEAGNVCFLRGPWVEEFFTVLEGFPDGAHDDHCDACSGAFNLLTDRNAPININPAVLRRWPQVRRGIRL